MPIDQDNFKALSDFAAVAAEYCQFIDRFREGRPDNLYTKLEALLPRIHRAILPVRSEMAEEKHSEFAALEMNHDQAAAISRLIEETVSPEKNLLIEWHNGIASSDMESYSPDATRAFMLFDDLAGIYRELRDGLALWNVGTPDAQAEAAWQWRFNYEFHWGEHLFQAMLTVHEIHYHFAD